MPHDFDARTASLAEVERREAELLRNLRRNDFDSRVARSVERIAEAFAREDALKALQKEREGR